MAASRPRPRRDYAADIQPLDVDALYRKHGHVVLRRARQILGNEDEAREVLQEIFLSLVDRPEQFGGRAKVTTWLYSVTTNRCFNRLRDSKNRQRLLRERVAPQTRRAASSGASSKVTAQQLMASMPPDYAAAAIYYYIDGMTHDEIAEVMACSPRHVGNLLTRAKAWASDREES